MDYYDLDVIISVGYRVKSLRGTQFRIWATNILKEYMQKGFVLDDDRLKRLGGGNYFDELLERIRDIRSSEKVFWRKVLEIYATSIDYDPRAESSILFFKQVQNKMYWAAHKHTAAERVVKHSDRAEADRFFNYPFAAIEEALSNAVYHRAYDEREPIEVRVEKDRIEILSFPGPDRSVTIEGLKSYRVSNRRYRNRRIGDFLKELHLTEGRNTGFKKILDALETNGSPKPEFETDEAHSYFISRLFIHEGFLKENQVTGNVSLNGSVVENKQESVDRMIRIFKSNLSDKEKEKMLPIIDYLKVNDTIDPQMARKVTGKSKTTVFRYLQRLIELDVIKSEGDSVSTVYRRK